MPGKQDRKMVVERIVIASRNRGKIKEFRAMFAGAKTQVLSLNDFSHLPEIIEDGETFFENALKKARIVAEATGEIAIADDSGLEVEALGGAPGIYSARYAGEGADDGKNMERLLNEMKGLPPEKRKAAFRCVLVVFKRDKSYNVFEGSWEGMIAEKGFGDGGFGYDPVFYLPDRGITAAQLSVEEKNDISHRAQAFRKMKKWLEQETDK